MVKACKCNIDVSALNGHGMLLSSHSNCHDLGHLCMLLSSFAGFTMQA